MKLLFPESHKSLSTGTESVHDLKLCVLKKHSPGSHLFLVLRMFCATKKFDSLINHKKLHYKN